MRQQPHPSAQFCALRGHASNVWSVGFSANDSHPLLCSGSSDKTVCIWRLMPQRQQERAAFTFARHSGTVWCCGFVPGSPDLVASGSSDKTLQIWSHATGEVLHCLATYNEAVESLSFSRDGTKLCTGSRDCRVVLWTNLITAASEAPVEFVLYQGEEWIRLVEFSKRDDDLLLTSGNLNSVLVWDLSKVPSPKAPQQTQSTTHRTDSKAVRFADNEDKGAVSNVVFETVQPIMELTGHFNTVWDACFVTSTSDHRLIASCSGDRSLRYSLLLAA